MPACLRPNTQVQGCSGATMSNLVLSDNTAGSNGGSMYVNGCPDTSIRNTLVSGNT